MRNGRSLGAFPQPPATARVRDRFKSLVSQPIARLERPGARHPHAKAPTARSTGLRYRLPERSTHRCGVPFGGPLGPSTDRSDFTLDHISHDEADADRGLDLLAFPRP
jgi:hypothetical protein